MVVVVVLLDGLSYAALFKRTWASLTCDFGTAVVRLRLPRGSRRKVGRSICREAERYIRGNGWCQDRQSYKLRVDAHLGHLYRSVDQSYIPVGETDEVYQMPHIATHMRSATAIDNKLIRSWGWETIIYREALKAL